MPLTLECYCGEASVSVCQLISLTLVVDLAAQERGHTAVGSFVFEVPGHAQFTLSHTSWHESHHHEHDLDLDIVDYWNLMQVTFGCDASMFQSPADEGSTYLGRWHILQTYQCTNTVTGKVRTFTISSINQAVAAEQCEVSGVIRSVTSVGGGAGISTLYMSTPLGACNGSSGTVGAFAPAPLADVIDTDESAEVCLCASGGAEPYYYAIASGELPCGQILNPTTGCIEGDVDGSCEGSEEVVFQVVDAAGAIAEITCNFEWPCAATPVAAIGNSFY